MGARSLIPDSTWKHTSHRRRALQKMAMSQKSCLTVRTTGPPLLVRKKVENIALSWDVSPVSHVVLWRLHFLLQVSCATPQSEYAWISSFMIKYKVSPRTLVEKNSRKRTVTLMLY